MKNNFWIWWICLLVCLPLVLYAQEDAVMGNSPTEKTETPDSSGKISLDIKGMDIIDVLKILSMRGNLNIIAGQGVQGRVTLFLKNVAVMDALDIILAANGLAYERRGDILNVMTDRNYELLYGETSFDKKEAKIIRLKFAKAAEVGNAITQLKSKIGKVVVDEASSTIVLIDVPQKVKELEEVVKNMDLPTQTKTFVLNYAKAEDLEAKIKESLTKSLGELKIDERMNKIIVTDLPEKIEYIGKLISDLDERDQVVLIEAKIIQITLNKDVGYGINWNNIFAGIDTITQSDLSIGLSGITADSTFTYTRSRGATDYGDQVILRLLEQLGKTNVLATPRITVANNQEAKVLVGTREAYVTSTITQSDSTSTSADNVQFVDVGVSLSVTPIITKDGYINLKIKPEVSSAPETLELTNSDGSVRTSVPIVTTAEAETQLLVKDGTTIIMAGLMKDTRKDNMEKIPGLGDLPLLGHFFRSRAKEDEKSELIIFLTPHILKEGDESSPMAQEYMADHELTGTRAEEGPSYRSPFPQPKPQPLAPALPEDEGESYLPLETEMEESLSVYVAPEETLVPQDFYDYCTYLSNKINQAVQENIPQGVEAQEVRLSFMVTSGGDLKDGPKILNAVNEELKDIVIESVKEASPFYPFPQDYEQDEETFQLTICFEKKP